MTISLLHSSDEPGPIYLRLAEEIEDSIAAGVLLPGAKLPPQRNLAFDKGVTIGTVGRAYAVLRQRGLVSGEVGRGTYVLARDHHPEAAKTGDGLSGTRTILLPAGKLAMDSTAAPSVGQAAILEDIPAQIGRDHPNEVTSYTRKLPPAWLQAGKHWLTAGGWSPDADAIIPTLGGHSAILAVIGAVTAPGDKIIFEHLTYSSIARSANLIGRRSIAVGMDEDGIEPEEFERCCAQQHPKLAFVIPGLHNPTLTTMSEKRRREIVEIARRHNVWLIEDAIYSALMEEQPTPIAALAPERTFYVGGLSKAVAAGLRAGWVACPPNLAPRILTAQKMLTGGMPFLLPELAARLVLSGEADRIRSRVRAEIEARGDIGRKCLEGYDFASYKHAPFIWLKLPEPWLSGTFKNAAANEGVLIDDEDEYKCGRTDRAFHRVRIGFTALATRAEVSDGFAKLRSLLDNRIAGYDTYG
jgi:DNA-binding transcriptional MocR family regulator